MSEQDAFAGFVRITETMVRESDGSFLPTFVDPNTREVMVLEGVPADADLVEVTRSWAQGMGQPQYFIAYLSDAAVIAEAYENGALTNSTTIPLTN